jgi:aryl-alcohol dehydrogenase-like predicted oxidoreductase
MCLGTMTFGPDWGWGSSIEESTRILDAYIARGGNFIDTANIYTKGHSEAIIGDHVGRDRAKRDRLVIATKFMGNMYPGDPNGGGAHRKGIIAACEQSLRRLRTDYIDLYWMHFSDPHTPIDETMRTLDDLVSSGKARYIGFSDTPAWKCVQAQYEAIFRSWAPLVALQIEYSLLERTVEADLMPMAREMGLGVTPWSPLKGGVLTGKYTRQNVATAEPGRGQWVKNHLNDRAFDVIDAITRTARECGPKVTPAQVALAWVQSRPGVASSIIGARTLAQLEDNLAALEVTLDADQLAQLDAASKVPLPFPHQFLQNVVDNAQGGTMINGRTSKVWNLSPQKETERH